MVCPHVTEKWAREAIRTLPRLRVFMVDDLRNAGDAKAPHGVNEVRLRGKRIVRTGLHITLTELRLRKSHTSARKRLGLDVARPHPVRRGKGTGLAPVLLAACVSHPSISAAQRLRRQSRDVSPRPRVP